MKPIDKLVMVIFVLMVIATLLGLFEDDNRRFRPAPSPQQQNAPAYPV